MNNVGSYLWSGIGRGYGGSFALHGSTSVHAFRAGQGSVRLTIEARNRLWSLLRIGMPVSLCR